MVQLDGAVLASDRQAEIVSATNHNSFNDRLTAIHLWGLICQMRASRFWIGGPGAGSLVRDYYQLK